MVLSAERDNARLAEEAGGYEPTLVLAASRLKPENDVLEVVGIKNLRS